MSAAWLRYFLQAICYMTFFGLIAFCSNRPVYQHMPSEHATIKISLRHSGQLLGQCRERTAEELAALPPNMRAPKICPRERSPLLVELIIDKKTFYKELIPPSGLSGDGMASLYKRFSVPVGEYEFEVRMKDHIDSKNYAYQKQVRKQLKPEQVFVIDFKAGEQGFIFL